MLYRINDIYIYQIDNHEFYIDQNSWIETKYDKLNIMGYYEATEIEYLLYDDIIKEIEEYSIKIYR